MSYWVVVVARNAVQHLPLTLDSLLGQTLKPKRIIVVDDGSTDGTAKVLADYAKRGGAILSFVTLPDRGYDVRRVPRNINTAWRTAEDEGLRAECFLISGDDCVYEFNYAKTLVSRMLSSPSVVVASGEPRSKGSVAREHVPAGSGRMVNCSFWRQIGSEYPVKAGWETWLLYKASEKSFEVRLFDDLSFQHLRPRGAGHQFAYWGAAMGTLGYHPLYAIGRIVKNVLVGLVAVRGCLNMLRGYLQAQLGSEDPFISPYEPGFRKRVNKEQAHRIAEIAASLLGR